MWVPVCSVPANKRLPIKSHIVLPTLICSPKLSIDRMPSLYILLLRTILGYLKNKKQTCSTEIEDLTQSLQECKLQLKLHTVHVLLIGCIRFVFNIILCWPWSTWQVNFLNVLICTRFCKHIVPLHYSDKCYFRKLSLTPMQKWWFCCGM